MSSLIVAIRAQRGALSNLAMERVKSPFSGSSISWDRDLDFITTNWAFFVGCDFSAT